VIISLYPKRLQQLLENWPENQINNALEEIKRTILSNSTIYLIGNGGSASTASHFATDLGVGSINRSNPVKCISLTENNAALTASANDYGYEDIFARQIRLLCEPSDLIWSISASGNSKNIIKGILEAKEIGCRTVGMTSFNGGELKNLVDVPIHVETELGEYGPAEDMHSIICHCITEVVRSMKIEAHE
jgi:D-sedoheptulose 7-phosphate isomerase